MAQIQIFSDTWFDMLEQANSKIGDLHLSPAMRDIRLDMLITPDDENLDDKNREKQSLTTAKTATITETVNETAINDKGVNEEMAEDDHQLLETVKLKLIEGRLYKDAFYKDAGPDGDDSKSTVSLSYGTMKKLLTELNMDIALQAFINGDITVIGDVSQLMALQMTKPSDEQKALFMAILENTKL